MAANANDFFVEAGLPGSATTLSANYTIADTSITVASTTNWPTATGVVFAIDVIDANGERVDGTYNVYQGTVATGTSITNVSHITGSGTDRNYAAGATTRVYIVVASEIQNRLVEGILQHANQSGDIDAQGVASFQTHIDVNDASTAIRDTSDNELVKFAKTASAVNELTIGNAATTGAPYIQATGGDTNINISLIPKGTGAVVKPFIGAKAYRSAAFNVTGGGGQEKISLDAESYDPQSAFDTANGRYVAPITGYYRVYAQIGLTDVADASQLLVLIYVNGAATSISRSVSSGATLDPTAVAYDVVYATAGQYIEMYADCTTTEPVNTGADTTYMTIEFAGL